MGTLGRVLLTLSGGWLATVALFAVTLGVVAASTGRGMAAGERAVVVSGLAYLLWSAAAVAVGARLNRGQGTASWAAPLTLGLALLVSAAPLAVGTLVLFNR